MSTDQEDINDFFRTKWLTNAVKKTPQIYSHPTRIASKIHPDAWVLDVGCGKNPFKQLLKNVVGIDPVFDEADIKTTIEDYQPDRLFDIATCLGSICFGDQARIDYQINRVVACLKPQAKIFWRLPPLPVIPDNLVHYEWTFDKLEQFANKYGFVQTNCLLDSTDRLYAEWHRD